MAGDVAAITAAAELTWAKAALGSPGPLLGMMRCKLNTTLPAERYRVVTQVGAMQLSRTLNASLRAAI